MGARSGGATLKSSEAGAYPIVVLTPSKNEEWIIERFLEVTSRFADLIIVADQQSTDATRSICSKYPQVHLIDNPVAEYDEASRQQLLIETARRLIPGPKILLALDCDEILAADALGSTGWKTMLHAAPGTVLVFEKVSLFGSPDFCTRSRPDFVAGFIDDGTSHRPKMIHSIRVPQPEDSLRLVLFDIKFLHYNLLRPRMQAAKMRMYAAIEKVRGTKGLYTRRRYYNARSVNQPCSEVQASDPAWFIGWERAGIDMRTIRDFYCSWQDLAAKRLILEHGERRFWLDDLWEIDWNTVGPSTDPRISGPPTLLRLGLRTIFGLLFRIGDTTRGLRKALK